MKLPRILQTAEEMRSFIAFYHMSSVMEADPESYSMDPCFLWYGGTAVLTDVQN